MVGLKKYLANWGTQSCFKFLFLNFVFGQLIPKAKTKK